MDLLLDTHALAWLSSGDKRLGQSVAAALGDAAVAPLVSAVTAWEFADLHARGRLPEAAELGLILDRFALRLDGIPANLWQLAASLPRHHLDPVDRMLIAHALATGATIATADKNIQSYQVPTLW